MDTLKIIANTLLFMLGLTDESPYGPTSTDDGIAEDWANVGADIASAINQYEQIQNTICTRHREGQA